MNKYIFQFGRNVDLSRAEIVARWPEGEEIEVFDNDFVLYEGEITDDLQSFLDTLGGTIRIAKYIDKVHFAHLKEVIVDYLEKRFIKDHKNLFGLSVFPENPGLIRLNLLKIKNLLKNNFSVRFLNRDFINLDAGTLHKEKVFVKNGVELILIDLENGGYILAETMAAQNVEKIAKRDYGKPVRDMDVGMLPPKLAMMMLNLTAKNGKFPNTIWDPFCGTGTMLVEAMMMGIKPIGSDISPEMVDASNKNFVHYFPDYPIQVFEQDASGFIEKKVRANAVCSEVYLGPIFHHSLTVREFFAAEDEVSPILEDFFGNLHNKFLGDRVVVAIPFWKMVSGKNAFLKKPLEIALKFWQTSEAFEYHTDRNSLLFRRPQQITGREIFVFQKK